MFGSPRCGVQACFHARCPCLEQPSPKNFRLRVHPSLTLSPLQSSFAYSPARHLSVLRRYLLLGFVPHRDITGGVYYSQGFQASLRSVHRLSQPLDGLLRHPALQVYFILQPRSGLTCSGASLPAQPLFLIERVWPPCRSACRCSPAETDCHTYAPRLRGFTPCEAAFSAAWG